MSETIETPPEPEPAGDDETVLDMAGVRKIRREAANLRKRVHELEELSEAQAARESAHQRAEVERIAAEHLVDAQDIWRAQPDIAAFADEFHEITRDRVVETAKALASEKPHLAKPNAAPPPTDRPVEGLRPGASPELKKKPTDWASALRL